MMRDLNCSYCKRDLAYVSKMQTIPHSEVMTYRSSEISRAPIILQNSFKRQGWEIICSALADLPPMGLIINIVPSLL